MPCSGRPVEAAARTHAQLGTRNNGVWIRLVLGWTPRAGSEVPLSLQTTLTSLTSVTVPLCLQHWLCQVPGEGRARCCPPDTNPTDTAGSATGVPSPRHLKAPDDAENPVGQSSGLPYCCRKEGLLVPKAPRHRGQGWGHSLRGNWCKSQLVQRERDHHCLQRLHGQSTVLRAATATQGNLSLPIDPALITRRVMCKQSGLARDIQCTASAIRCRPMPPSHEK